METHILKPTLMKSYASLLDHSFKELQGHLLIMIKALYGTRSGGARWHDRLFDILQELKFKPSKADPDVWMRPDADVAYAKKPDHEQTN